MTRAPGAWLIAMAAGSLPAAGYALGKPGDQDMLDEVLNGG
ncbi:hypothetical protein [Rhodanobacter sp. B05]|nr:hypothetical protein [Rhodanobacter sp. B05]